MGTCFFKGDLDVPARDVPRNDLQHGNRRVCAKQGKGRALSGWIAQDDPADRKGSFPIGADLRPGRGLPSSSPHRRQVTIISIGSRRCIQLGETPTRAPAAFIVPQTRLAPPQPYTGVGGFIIARMRVPDSSYGRGKGGGVRWGGPLRLPWSLRQCCPNTDNCPNADNCPKCPNLS